MSSTGMPRTKSLGRAAILLRAVASSPTPASASQLARVSGIPRSTVTRTLATLADIGFVDETPGGWALGYELVRLGRSADPHRHLLDVAYPALSRLRDDTEESALLAVPLGRPGMEILLQLDPARHVGVASWVGVDVPLHASSAGKVILGALSDEELDAWLETADRKRYTERTLVDVGALRAELARVERRQWAELVDELEDGLVSLSVPVRGHGGALEAVIGLSGPSFRLGRQRRRALLPRLRGASSEIEAALTGGRTGA